MYHSPNFCSNPYFLYSSLYLYPYLSGVVMMRESLMCQWIPSPTGREWLLQSGLLFPHIKSCVREEGPFLYNQGDPLVTYA